MTSLRVPPGASESDVTQAVRACEQIAAKDRSNLYFVSRFLEEPARYEAFVAMYAVMRLIDDAVDDVPDKSQAGADVRAELLRELDRWQSRILSAHRLQPVADPIDLALQAALYTFPTPVELWLNFIDSMRYDVEIPGFGSYADFLQYGEGATIAPTVIYVYILTAVRDADGSYRPNAFDYHACGRELGLFAYLAHILRDVRQDAMVGQSGLVYLSDSDLRLHGLDRNELRKLATAAEGDSRWAALVHDLCARAREMERRGAALAEAHYDAMRRDCAFILCLIISLYQELLERIDRSPERVFLPEPLISNHEKSLLALDCARRVRYSQVKVATTLATCG